MSYELSIAIVLYNSAGTLRECLQSLQPAVENGFAEVIAVDNASPDASASIVQEVLPHAEVIVLSENLGFAAGVNAALPYAHGRYWMLLNPDVRVPPLGLEALVSFMDHHSNIGLASPELRGMDGRWESPGRSMPSISHTLLELTRLHRLLPRSVRGRILRGPYWAGGDQLDAGWVPATAVIMRPKVTRDAGQLREDLFMYGEDLEWCWRIRRAGWMIGVCATVEFLHRGSTSANFTFGEADKARRSAAGYVRACQAIYGQTYARSLAAVTALALALEARGPGRDEAHRLRARAAASEWWRLARVK